MAGKIFLNYRRGDDPGFTHALYQQLEGEFKAASLFMDVEGHIKAGDDFVEVIRDQVAAADVLLVVIGPRWVDLLLARTNDAEDFVAIEIMAALEQSKRLIPVLVGGAAMPRAETLPEAIRSLARRNAVSLRPDRFRVDCQSLVGSLREYFAGAERERQEHAEAERMEAERKRREERDAAKQAVSSAHAARVSTEGRSDTHVQAQSSTPQWALPAAAAAVIGIAGVAWAIATWTPGSGSSNNAPESATTAASTGPSKSAAAAVVATTLTRQRNWRLASATMLTGVPEFLDHDEFATRIKSLSGGKLTINPFAAGELLPAVDVLNGVAQGIVDMGWAPAHLFAGRERAMMVVSGALPLGHGPRALAEWATGAGDMVRSKIYARSKIVALPCRVEGPGIEWYRQEIKSPAGFKGLKLRTFGLAAQVAQKLGAVPQSLPAGEVATAFTSRVVDGATWSFASLPSGLNLKGAVYYRPGWHQPTSLTDLLIGEAMWNEMSDPERAALRSACKSFLSDSIVAAEQASQSAAGESRQYPEAVIQALRRATSEVLNDEARKSELLKEALESYRYPTSG